ncbi:hypothetical protein COY27_06430 [Candidatus Woesearchaeota archaeon CG_4_10_14_0_2_um_filter_33_13]|nr:MAG: hypothetical protein COY27_06430 [Candidatus Woesearchaeota archaeon CG_4_10_14_0_2_um_filter_33_13]
MLKSDELKLKIIELLSSHQILTIGKIKKLTKTPHHYTISNALEFLEKVEIIEIKEKKDKLGSKIVKLKDN